MSNTRSTHIENNKFYHIYNRGINGETIFKTDSNKDFFLNKVADYLLPVCDIYAFCILSNHFHFLVKIKSEKELLNLVKNIHHNNSLHEKGLHSVNNIFSKQFSKIFNSYSQAFNKQNDRHGALIESPFRRKEIITDEYLRSTIIYIHQNPQTHSIVKDFRKFKYSSYKSIISDTKTSVSRNEVINLFDTKDNFIYCHLKPVHGIEFE